MEGGLSTNGTAGHADEACVRHHFAFAIGLKYTYIHKSWRLAHKTITISEDAYRALTKLKKGKESFTEAILRLTSGRGDAASLLNYLEHLPPSIELAETIETVMKRTRRAALRKSAMS